MSKKLNVFGQAALAAYKKRQAKTGGIGWFSPGSPLVEAAKDDPEAFVMDADWLTRTLMSIPEEKQASLGAVVKALVRGMPGGDTETNRVYMLYRFLKSVEAGGHLAAYREPASGPRPRQMTEAEADAAADYLKHREVIPEGSS